MTAKRKQAIEQAAKIVKHLPGLVEAIADSLADETRTHAAAFHSWALASNAGELVDLLKPFSKNPSNPTDVDPADELAVERAFDRFERARRAANKYVELSRERGEAGKPIDAEIYRLGDLAWQKYMKASAATRAAVRKFERKYGQSVTLAHGYWQPLGGGNPCGGEFKRPRKRSRKATANPAPLPRLALLGEVTELRIASHGGPRTLRARGMLLLASGDGKTIVVARPLKSSRATMPRDERGARRMYEKWSARKASSAVRLTLPDKPITVDLGHVELIRYRSSKWTGKPTLYEHPFKHKAPAIADSYRSPRVIRIVADPPRVIVSERGIIG